MTFAQGSVAQKKHDILREQSLASLVNKRFIIFETLAGSDAVLRMSRGEFNELSSCEVRRLNQFETASDWLSRSSSLAQPRNGCGPALIRGIL